MAASACGGGTVRQERQFAAEDRPAGGARDQAAVIDRDVARVRAATAPYRVLDSAVAAGYPREVKECLADEQHGAMGFHHIKRELLDDTLELERPEILLYARTVAGEYRLNGVEYIVPYRARSREDEPPEIMGQKLKRSDPLKLWYLHVWVWEENPAGLFADWNPAVRC